MLSPNKPGKRETSSYKRILDIEQSQVETLSTLRDALMRGDNAEVERIAWRLAGFEERAEARRVRNTRDR
jgi:hypothetical protein